MNLSHVLDDLRPGLLVISGHVGGQQGRLGHRCLQGISGSFPLDSKAQSYQTPTMGSGGKVYLNLYNYIVVSIVVSLKTKDCAAVNNIMSCPKQPYVTL